MRLDQLQHDFVKAIFGDNPEAAASYVVGDDTLNAQQRFGIYRGSVHGILTSALEETFPVCRAMVGETFFDKMCDVFIDQHPPTSPYFAKYGGELSFFLKTFEPAQSVPYLADIADLEWARNEVWHQQHPEPFDFSTLATLNETQQASLQFQLTPTLRLLDSNYRIDLLWFAHQQDSDEKLEQLEWQKAVKLMVWKGLDGIKIIQIENNSEQLWHFLNAISEQKNVTQLAEEFADTLPELLNQGIQEGWIQSYSLK